MSIACDSFRLLCQDDAAFSNLPIERVVSLLGCKSYIVKEGIYHSSLEANKEVKAMVPNFSRNNFLQIMGEFLITGLHENFKSFHHVVQYIPIGGTLVKRSIISLQILNEAILKSHDQVSPLTGVAVFDIFLPFFELLDVACHSLRKFLQLAHFNMSNVIDREGKAEANIKASQFFDGGECSKQFRKVFALAVLEKSVNPLVEALYLQLQQGQSSRLRLDVHTEQLQHVSLRSIYARYLQKSCIIWKDFILEGKISKFSLSMKEKQHKYNQKSYQVRKEPPSVLCLYLITLILIVCMKSIEIAFVGSIGSGKTSLVKRCMDEGFAQGKTKPTIGIQFYQAQLRIGKVKYKCSFMDSQGFDRNRGILGIPLFKRCHGFIVVYDVTDPVSFQNSKLCYEEIMQYCMPECQNIAFIGNKIDMQNQRKVKYMEANQFCCKNKINYAETSALQNDYIKNMVQTIATNLICSGKFKSEHQKKQLKLTLWELLKAKQKGCWKKFKQLFD